MKENPLITENNSETKSETAAAATETVSRRGFLGKLGKAAVIGASIGAVGAKPFLDGKSSEVAAQKLTNLTPTRAQKAYEWRSGVAFEAYHATPPHIRHPSNDDEILYPNRIGNFTKGMPHDANGEVIPAAYNQLLTAANSGSPADFEAIPIGGTRKFVNPQAGLAFDLEGADSHALVMPPPPPFASRVQAADIAENYWMSVLRDTPLAEFPTSPAAAAAAADLMSFGSDFKGPKHSDGTITPDLLFRGLTAGDKAGPYFSQFLYQPMYVGANFFSQKIRTVRDLNNGGLDYGIDYAGWLSMQNGVAPSSGIYADEAKFIYRGRDIGEYVHVDVIFQEYLQAAQILNAMGAPFDQGNPYNSSNNQEGFGTFGIKHIISVLSGATYKALKSMWFQKWIVHRRLRPEAFAGRVHQTVYMNGNHPIHPDILASVTTSSRLGGFLRPNNAFLPQAFPEGSPLHPSYGAGHATVAATCVTLLKAFYDESFVIPNPLMPDATGDNLVPYTGATALTVGGELNKLANNVGLGRNFAGVHWRSDNTESLKLGEAIAISIMRDQKSCYNEQFNGFSLTKFDGTTVTV